MDAYTPDFSLDVQGVKGFCPAGEAYAKRQIEKKTIPVLSCEGPCVGAVAILMGIMFFMMARFVGRLHKLSF